MTYVADVRTAVARQTYVWCMAIVRQKYSSHGHCTLRVATRLQTKLYVTLTTGTSNVRLSYVTLLIISMRFLTLRSATGATTGKTLIHDHQTRTLTYSQKINYIGKKFSRAKISDCINVTCLTMSIFGTTWYISATTVYDECKWFYFYFQK